MNSSLKNIFLFITLFIIVFIYVLFIVSTINANNIYFLLSNILLFIYSLYRIFYSKNYNYSLYQIFYLFSLFFFCLAPMIQYTNNVSTVFGYFILDDIYLKINLFLFLLFFVIDFVYFLTDKYSKKQYFVHKKDYYLKDNIFLKIIIISLICISLFFVFYINNFNLKGIFLRGGIDVARSKFVTSSLNLFLKYTLRPFPIFIFIFYYSFGKNKIFKIFLFVAAILACFPMALPRFLTGAYYIPIALILFPKLRIKNLFAITYMFILTTLFPILSIFRNIDRILKYSSFIDVATSVMTKIYTSSAYDSYQSFAFVFQEKFITYGKQLIGVFSIWIPRSIWENKPIGTGYTIAEKYGLSWSNIAMNFFGEGYSNFGIFGVFIFAICIAIFMAYIDSWFWNKHDGNIKYINTPFYLIIFALETYVLRGDLMSSSAALVGTLLSCLIVKKIFSLFLIENNLNNDVS